MSNHWTRGAHWFITIADTDVVEDSPAYVMVENLQQASQPGANDKQKETSQEQPKVKLPSGKEKKRLPKAGVAIRKMVRIKDLGADTGIRSGGLAPANPAPKPAAVKGAKRPSSKALNTELFDAIAKVKRSTAKAPAASGLMRRMKTIVPQG